MVKKFWEAIVLLLENEDLVISSWIIVVVFSFWDLLNLFINHVYRT